MIDIKSQPTPEGSTAPIDDEICDQVLGMRPYYVRGLGHGITTPSSSCSSRADIYAACDARLTEVQKQVEQRVDELTTRIDEYQRLQIQMMERMTQMEQIMQLIRQQ